MKVKNLIKDLQKANPEAIIEFAASPQDTLEILSIYTAGYGPEIDNKSNKLYIDLG